MAIYSVYIVASQKNGTLYVGITSDLPRRIYEHKHGIYDGFTKRYAVHRLVYYECFEDATLAIQREKHLKAWKRLWKLRLIEEQNPQWDDLYDYICGVLEASAPRT